MTLTITTNLTFILDGVESPPPFLWQPIPEGTEGYRYNIPVYTNTAVGSASSLPSGLHNLTVQSYAAVLFDYAIYTYVAADLEWTDHS